MITDELTAEVQRLRAAREPFVHATVVRAARPTSVRAGDSAIVLPDGTIKGFVGGTCAQASVRLYAVRALETEAGLLLRLVPGADGAAGAAEVEEGVVVAHNPCLSGGSLDIFLDPQPPAQRIVVVGDTPIARALDGVATAAGYDVARGAEVVPDARDAALIVASHGAGEEAALVRALEAGVGYVGLVASPRRGAAVRASLEVGEELRGWVHTPAGLDIGARAPAEVAIAILAEVVASRTAQPVMPVVAAATPAPAVLALTAVDPICGMSVVAGPASVQLEVDGERVFFCCTGCRDAYAAQRAADVGVR